MADEYVTTDQYDAIRAAIDISLTDKLITARVIELPIYLPAARLWASNQLAGVTISTDSQRQAITNAIIYYCAALLIPAVPQILEEAHANNQSYKRSAVNWDAMGTMLNERATDAIAQAIQSTNDPLQYKPTNFTLARGYRGR